MASDLKFEFAISTFYGRREHCTYVDYNSFYSVRYT